MSILWCCPSSISLLTTASPTLPGSPKNGFGEAVLVCDMLKPCKFFSWQLQEEVPVDQQGSWSCSAPSHWSCVPSRRCGEVSSGTWFQNSASASKVYVSQPERRRKVTRDKYTPSSVCWKQLILSSDQNCQTMGCLATEHKDKGERWHLVEGQRHRAGDWELVGSGFELCFRL